jgi:hypothetical protein
VIDDLQGVRMKAVMAYFKFLSFTWRDRGKLWKLYSGYTACSQDTNQAPAKFKPDILLPCQLALFYFGNCSALHHVCSRWQGYNGKMKNCE